MMKLMTCEKNSFGSHPKVSAVSRNVSIALPPVVARNSRAITVSLAGLAKCRRLRSYLAHQVECVEDNRLCQSDRQNGVDEDGRKGTWVATNGRGHTQSCETDAYANPHRGQADMNASVNFCQ